MAKKEGRKSTQLACDFTGNIVTFKQQTRNADDSWETVKQVEFDCEAVKDLVYENGETFLAYGVRAWLADRTSQFRTLGEKAVLDAMQDYWKMATDPTDPQWTAKRSRSGSAAVDPALVRLISEMANISEMLALENVKKADKDMLSAIKAKYASRYASIKQELINEAEGIDLNNLLDL